MTASLEICGIEARVKHCRARLKLTSDVKLRSFLQSMLEEGEEILNEMIQTRVAVFPKIGQEDNIPLPRRLAPEGARIGNLKSQKPLDQISENKR